MNGTITAANVPATANQTKRRRTIRVFISSTFKDMTNERNELIKFVFPRLQKICEERGVLWSEVDLRWGVTDEQMADGKVLPICLAEIENCSPFFIGILGERYGWVPEIPALLAESQPWLLENTGKSVTELEILHGAFRKPNEPVNAFFYFRDPGYVTGLPEEELGNYIETISQEELDRLTEEDAASLLGSRKQNLSELKDRIRNSGHQLKENFTDAKHLGELVFEDFSALIDKLFPANEIEDEQDRKNFEHETFAMARSKYFVGRESYLEKMSSFIREDGPPLVFAGDSGGGKSALLSYWALDYLNGQRENQTHYPTIMHFIGATPQSGDTSALMRRLILELNRQFGLSVQVPADSDGLRRALAQAFSQAGEKGRAVILLDAVNQLEGQQEQNDLFWLPNLIPANIRLIITTTKGPEMEEFKNREWNVVPLEPLNEDERKNIIGKYFSAFGKSLEAPIVDAISNHPLSKNALFLRTLLEELKLYGDNETIRAEIKDYLNIQSIDELFFKKLGRLEKDFGGILVKNAMSLLWGVRTGLSESDLLRMLGNSPDEKLSSSQWSPLYLAIETNLVNHSGFISLFHNYLRDAVEKRYLKSDSAKKEIHRRLADYFNGESRVHHRVMEELPWQLAKANEWRLLFELLKEFDFVSALWAYDPFEVKHYWALVEENTKPWKPDFVEELDMLKAYNSVITAPQHADRERVLLAAELLEERYVEEALALQNFMKLEYEETSQSGELLKCIGHIAKLLMIKGKYTEAMDALEELERLAVSYSLDDDLQNALGNQAEIQFHWGKYSEAMELLSRQEELCRKVNNKAGLQKALGMRGRILGLKQEYEKALDLLSEKERLCIQINNKDGLQEAIGERATIFKNQGRHGEALDLLKIQEQICRSIGNMDDLQHCLGIQASVLYDMDAANKPVVLGLLKEQDIICTHINHKNGLQSVYGMQGKIHAAEKNEKSAMNLFQKQEKLCRELDNKLALQECLGRQVMIYMKRNKTAQAMEALAEQEAICREFNFLTGLQIALNNKALHLRQQGQAFKALEVTAEQKEICLKIGNQHGVLKAMEMEAWTYKRMGDLDRAFTVYHEQEALAERIGYDHGVIKAWYEQANVHSILGDMEAALKLYRQGEERAVISGNKKDIIQNSRRIEQLERIIKGETVNVEDQIVDFTIITPLEAFVLSATHVNGKMTTPELRILLENKPEFGEMDDTKIQKMIWVLKNKGVIFSYKAMDGNRKRTIFHVSDIGLYRLEKLGINPADIDIPEVALLPKKAEGDEAAAPVFDPELPVTQFSEILEEKSYSFEVRMSDKGTPYFVLRDGSTEMIVVAAAKENKALLPDLFDYLNEKTRDWHLVAREERFLYTVLMQEYYSWLKARHGKIRNAKNKVTIHSSFFQKFIDGENVWRLIKL